MHIPWPRKKNDNKSPNPKDTPISDHNSQSEGATVSEEEETPPLGLSNRPAENGLREISYEKEDEIIDPITGVRSIKREKLRTFVPPVEVPAIFHAIANPDSPAALSPTQQKPEQIASPTEHTRLKQTQLSDSKDSKKTIPESQSADTKREATDTLQKPVTTELPPFTDA